MRKSSIVVILVLLALLCALWSPWQRWNLALPQLFGIAPKEQIGGLQVSSLAGEMQVFVDGNLVGTVSPTNSPLLVPAVTPGDRQIKLVRKSPISGEYQDFNQLIRFESGVDVVLAYELGPTTDFSQGHVIFASKRLDGTQDVILSVNSSLSGVKVVVDDATLGTTPLAGVKLSIDKQHQVILSKAGYDSQEFTLLPKDQSDRDKLKGYNVNVDADLFLQPITVQ